MTAHGVLAMPLEQQVQHLLLQHRQQQLDRERQQSRQHAELVALMAGRRAVVEASDTIDNVKARIQHIPDKFLLGRCFGPAGPAGGGPESPPVPVREGSGEADEEASDTSDNVQTGSDGVEACDTSDNVKSKTSCLEVEASDTSDNVQTGSQAGVVASDTSDTGKSKTGSQDVEASDTSDSKSGRQVDGQSLGRPFRRAKAREGSPQQLADHLAGEEASDTSDNVQADSHAGVEAGDARDNVKSKTSCLDVEASDTSHNVQSGSQVDGQSLGRPFGRAKARDGSPQPMADQPSGGEACDTSDHVQADSHAGVEAGNARDNVKSKTSCLDVEASDTSHNVQSGSQVDGQSLGRPFGRAKARDGRPQPMADQPSGGEACDPSDNLQSKESRPDAEDIDTPDNVKGGVVASDTADHVQAGSHAGVEDSDTSDHVKSDSQAGTEASDTSDNVQSTASRPVVEASDNPDNVMGGSVEASDTSDRDNVKGRRLRWADEEPTVLAVPEKGKGKKGRKHKKPKSTAECSGGKPMKTMDGNTPLQYAALVLQEAVGDDIKKLVVGHELLECEAAGWRLPSIAEHEKKFIARVEWVAARLPKEAMFDGDGNCEKYVSDVRNLIRVLDDDLQKAYSGR